MTGQSPWNLDDPALISAIDELPFWSAPFGEVLLETVHLRRNLKALDLGSGLGFPALELAQRLGPSAQVYALDPWRAAADRLRQKMAQYGLSNVTVVDGTAERMPFEDATFDLVTSNNGLNNVQDLRQAWRECSRVSKPGAQLVLTENLPATMEEFYGCFKDTLLDLGFAECLPTVDAHIYQKRKPLEETRRIISDSGFEVVAEKRREFIMRFLDGTAMLNAFLIRLAFLPSWKALVPEEEQDRVLQEVEADLNRLAAERGELALTIPFVCLDCRKR
jgi:arsenite methyltransferase